MSDQIYDDRILGEYEVPYHRGHVSNPTFAREEENPICGDGVRLELVVDADQRIIEAWFDGHGCAISQAAASILVRNIEGRTIEEMKEFQATQVLDLLRVRLTPMRQQCGLLAFNVLQSMLCKP